MREREQSKQWSCQTASLFSVLMLIRGEQPCRDTACLDTGRERVEERERGEETEEIEK